MAINITLPKITAANPNKQMRQMQSYIYQLAEQLNWALGTLESSSGGNVSPAIKMENGSEVSQKDAENTFNSIKALIIKSADIVKAYEETITSNFKGKYFADSDFGTYVKETSRSVVENSEKVIETFNRVEQITGKVNDIDDEVTKTEAYIKRGHLGYHERLKKEVYGVAVGQTEGGVYRNYAWFIPEGLCLFNENGTEVAYVSQHKLYIQDAAFLGTVQFGGYRIDTTDGVAFTWIG
jgi:hypothetical protein